MIRRLAIRRLENGPLAHIAAALVLAGALAMPLSPASAQAPSQPDALTPVEEFSKQLDAFKKSIPDLNKKIEDSAAAVDRWTDVGKARKEIEELRAIVGAALGAVSDNGAVSSLGVQALNHARSKLRALEQDTRFKPEEKQFLTDQWRRLRDETERATEELGNARREFAERSEERRVGKEC